jgi:hypothetical protein
LKCIVPLAGPDLQSERYGLRPLMDVDGTPLIDAVLRMRAWARALRPDDYIFVVRQVEALAVLTDHLGRNWPGCRIVTLSHLTGGALYSVMAATALVPPGEALIVDLADILFSAGPADPEAQFANGCGAIVPVFTSSEDCYSYLTFEDGRVTGAREKAAISNSASGGVYMFRDVQTFLRAAAHSIDHRDALSWNGALFVCPMVNGVIEAGDKVHAPHIGTCRPVGKLFHANPAA